MTIFDVQAIDVHGHYGVYLKADGGEDAFMSGDADTVVRRAKEAYTSITIVSPLKALLPRHHADPVAGNREAAKEIPRHPELRQWVVLDPTTPETFAQAEEALKQPSCAGIKIHPEEHGYPIVEHGRAIFEFAAERGAIIATHSGEANSLPSDFIPFANDFPEVQLILAHMGFGFDGDFTRQVRAVQSAKNANVFTDTSSTMSIVANLLEWAVEQIGAERILYGTDTPLYFAPMHRARIDHAEMPDDDKRKILRDNSLKLFGLTRSVVAEG